MCVVMASSGLRPRRCGSTGEVEPLAVGPEAAAEAMIGFVADQATVLRPGVERLIASTETWNRSSAT